MALYFAVGAFLDGGGRIVEVGSYEGGSAAFLAAGLRRRGRGRLSCIDAHTAGPPWLGTAPWRWTLATFRATIEACGVAGWVEVWVGDSRSVASVWPAEEIDCVLIDADHSFRGALADVECFASKLRVGGLVMIDDAEDPVLTELLDLVDELKCLRGLRYLRTVAGVAVFERVEPSSRLLLGEIAAMARRRELPRPWSLEFLHDLALPHSFLRQQREHRGLRTWGMLTAYHLCFLARCGPGDYGHTDAAPRAHRRILTHLSADRGDGAVVAVEGARPAGLRAVLCLPEEAADCARMLQPGGVLIAINRGDTSPPASMAVRRLLLAAGLDGCGWYTNVHWGIRDPHALSAEEIARRAAEAMERPGR